MWRFRPQDARIPRSPVDVLFVVIRILARPSPIVPVVSLTLRPSPCSRTGIVGLSMTPSHNSPLSQVVVSFVKIDRRGVREEWSSGGVVWSDSESAACSSTFSSSELTTVKGYGVRVPCDHSLPWALFQSAPGPETSLPIRRPRSSAIARAFRNDTSQLLVLIFA
jgi:hypothetical protein